MRDQRATIAVVGDASVAPGSTKDALAEQTGRLLVEAGYRVVTGGLGGVMESACRGAHSSSAWQPGTTIGILPGTDPSDANPFVDLIIPTGLDHGRNLMVAQSDAIIAIGGGAGTLSEIALAWIHRRLIVALTCDGWSGRLAGTRIDDRVRYPDQDDDRVFAAASATEALAILKERLASYSRRHARIRRR